MLPFLKKSKEASVSAPVEHITRESDHKEMEGGDDEMLKVVAEELLDAIHSRKVGNLIEALRAAFQILDSEPHEEGPHLEPIESMEGAE